MDPNMILDPLAALYLREGELRAEGTDPVLSALRLWRQFAEPQGSLIHLPSPLTLRRVEHWARNVTKASPHQYAHIYYAGPDGLMMGYASPNGWEVDLTVSSKTGAAVDELHLGWKHGGRPTFPLLRIVGQHLWNVFAWSDPTPLELQTIAIEQDGAPNGLPDDFGWATTENRWNLFGVRWPAAKGGVLRLPGGSRGFATIPQVLFQEAGYALTRGLRRGWKIYPASLRFEPVRAAAQAAP